MRMAIRPRPTAASTKHAKSALIAFGRANPSVVNDDPLVMTASCQAMPSAQKMGMNASITSTAQTAGRLSRAIGP
jgi:hypothetical protein